MNYQNFETSVSFIKNLNNRIIRIQVKKGVVIDKQGIRENRLIYEKILQGEKGLFLTIFNEFNTAGEGVKKEFESINHIENKEAEAFVVNGLSNRIELEFFTKMTKTIYPTAVFNDEKEAMKWLMDFQD